MQDLLMVTVLALTVVLWFWALKDILKAEYQSPGSRMVWLLIIFLFPVMGSLMFFQLKNRLMVKERRKFQPDFRRE